MVKIHWNVKLAFRSLQVRILRATNYFGKEWGSGSSQNVFLLHHKSHQTLQSSNLWPPRLLEIEREPQVFLLLCKLLYRRRIRNRNRGIEGQTANFLTSRTGLWARCSTSLLEFEKYLMSLLAETKRRVIPATKFKLINYLFTYIFIFIFYLFMFIYLFIYLLLAQQQYYLWFALYLQQSRRPKITNLECLMTRVI